MTAVAHIVRETVRTLVDLGQLPTDTELDEATAKRFAEAFSAVDRPSADEAAALVALLPPDSNTSFGLAWTLVHLIESSPTWPDANVLDDRNYWVALLRERSARSA